jgi:PRTRC genetic system protein A
MKGLIGYRIDREETDTLPSIEGGLFDYALAGDGLYLHAEREHLEVFFPIASASVRGLPDRFPLFDFRLPRVPADLLERFLTDAVHFGKHGLETLAHITWSPVYPWNDGWDLETPRQTRSFSNCRPLDDGPGSSYERAIIEIHSHHSMAARFSPTDDQDETGFRLYGVVGRLDSEPEIRFRVGVYGYFWEVPSSWVLELPEGLADCVEYEMEAEFAEETA